ncbi:unnamed protein product [Victoria cruziana]
MGSEREPARQLLPYLQRADELQKHEPLVAYYCRLYAMDLGIQIPQKDRTSTTKSLLVSLMNQLEKDKKSLKLNPEDHLHVEGFALNVFGKADKQDRAGRADLNTAKTFYAASIFFEILGQFGDLQPEIEQKMKYAAWKAADIRKALKEGRKPEPGPPGGDKDLSVPSSDFSDPSTASSAPSISSTATDEPGHIDTFSLNHAKQDIPSTHPDDKKQAPPSHKTPFSYPTADYPSPIDTHHNATQQSPLKMARNLSYSQPYYQPPPQEHYEATHVQQQYPSHDMQPNPRLQDLPPTSQYNPGGKNGAYREKPQPSAAFTYDCNYQPPPEKIAEAHKAARFAVGALAFDDVPVAVDFLRRSLELLTNPSATTHE